MGKEGKGSPGHLWPLCLSPHLCPCPGMHTHDMDMDDMDMADGSENSGCVVCPNQGTGNAALEAAGKPMPIAQS